MQVAHRIYEVILLMFEHISLYKLRFFILSKESHSLQFFYTGEDNAWTSLLEMYTIHLTIFSRCFFYLFFHV